MNIKTKNIALGITLCLSTVLVYGLGISRTIALKKKFTHLKEQSLHSKKAPERIATLYRQQQHYDSLLSTYQLQGTSMQNNLLKAINDYANKNDLKVVDFLKPHLIEQNDLIVKTHQFTVEGSYNAIIKLIHQLEQDSRLGRIIHVHYEKKKNIKRDQHFLQAFILLQQLS